QLIANLWRTDELVNEMDILTGEIDKKNQQIDNYVLAEQEKYVSQAIEQHAESQEVKDYEAYEAFVQKVADYKTISIIAAVIVGILLGDLLFVFGVKFLYVAIFWVISPFVLYFIYKKSMGIYIAKKEPAKPQTEAA
ncbi:MAG TPA: hypothetical protein DCY20_05835, partial [Firmicutes bacterium]|nr:hypothetical protein [Bacillota bacterium]